MRVVHVVEAAATGTLSMVALAANAAAVRGWEVTVIYSRRPATPAALGGLFHPAVRLVHIRMGTVWQFPRAVVRLRARLTALAPDCVHAHSSLAGFVTRVALVGARPGCTVLYSPHCIAFMRTDIGAARRAAFVALERLAQALTRCTYLACSESERQAIAQQLPGVPVLVVANGIDGGPFGSAAPRPPRGACRVITVGEIRRQKDPERFAAIARAVGRRVGGEFVWVGDGDVHGKALLRAAGVAVVGWRPREGVAVLLQDADIYMSTSSWEGLSVSLIEGMCAGLPAVVSACSGNVDIVQSGVNGFVCATVEQSCAALERLMEDAALRRRLGRNAAAMARERYGIERFANELLAVYEGRATPAPTATGEAPGMSLR